MSAMHNPAQLKESAAELHGGYDDEIDLHELIGVLRAGWQLIALAWPRLWCWGLRTQW